MWNYAGSAQAFAFYGRLRPNDRRRLLRALDRMAQQPPLGDPSGVTDEAGRALLLWSDDGFEILFWQDHAAREPRIVEIEWRRS
jgi:hypothetical protein